MTGKGVSVRLGLSLCHNLWEARQVLRNYWQQKKGRNGMGQNGNSEMIRRYLDGLKRYSEKGIPILIDGKAAEPAAWETIFQVCDDGSFYMGDYILMEEEGDGENKKTLKEIRFDKVYYR